MLEYSQFPFPPTIPISPFEIHIPDAQLQDFHTLLSLCPLPPENYENTCLAPGSGLSHAYLSQCKADLLSGNVSWRAYESHLNSFPNYMATITDDDDGGQEYDIHFLALFSSRKPSDNDKQNDDEDNVGATKRPRRKRIEPVIFLHGFPSHPFAFLPILSLLRSKYTPQSLPYHIIVPSIPGFAFSSSPPPTRAMSIPHAAKLMDKLMVGLGFGCATGGYTAQANDLGSFLARHLYSRSSSSCTSLHLSMLTPPPAAMSPTADTSSWTPDEKICREKILRFRDKGHGATAVLQARQPGLVGAVAGASPWGVLAWVGSAVWAWANTGPTGSYERIHGKVLETAMLYFFTQTLSRGLWFSREVVPSPSPSTSPYPPAPAPAPAPALLDSASPCRDRGSQDRAAGGEGDGRGCGGDVSVGEEKEEEAARKKNRGVAYTCFTHDIVPVPESWAREVIRDETGGEELMKFWKHERGGHFGCWEEPELLLGNLEEFIADLI